MKRLLIVALSLFCSTQTAFAVDVDTTWNAVSGASGYKIERNSGSGYSQVGQTSGLLFTDLNVPTGTHCYRGKSTVGGVDSQPSTESCVSITSPTPTPDPTPTPTPGTVKVPPATSLTDSQGAVWTLGGMANAMDKIILRNGQMMPGAASQLIFCNAQVYAWANYGGGTYWSFNGSGWNGALSSIPCQ